MPTFGSTAEILQELSRLTALQQGWQFLPLDKPEEAAFGYVAFRNVRPDGTPVSPTDGKPGQDVREETISYDWLPFGHRLRPERHLCKTAQEFETMLADLQRRGPVYPCDNPVERLVGFVAYRPSAGSSFLLQMSLTAFKEASEDLRRHVLICQAMHR